MTTYINEVNQLFNIFPDIDPDLAYTAITWAHGNVETAVDFLCTEAYAGESVLRHGFHSPSRVRFGSADQGTSSRASSPTNICEATTLDDTEAITQMLIDGYDVNLIDDHGRSPLMIAALWAGPETVSVLLQAGANMAIKDKDGDTPIKEVRKRGDPRNILPLIEIAIAENKAALRRRLRRVILFAYRFHEHLVSVWCRPGGGAFKRTRDEYEAASEVFYGRLTCEYF